MTASVRLAYLLVVFFTMQASVSHAMPPVQTFGKISSTYRTNKPSEGTDSSSLTNTLEVGASSYIWEPWFGIWRATGAISKAATDADQDTTSGILTGDIEVNLFHRSHFPLSVFVGVRDSRVEIENLSEATSDLRTVRFGVTQQYQDLAAGVFYLGTFNRDEQEDLQTGARSTSDRLLLSVDRRGQVHSVTGVGTFNQTSNTVASSDVNSSQVTVSHHYRPTNNLSVNSTANVAVIEGNSDFLASDTLLYGAATQAEWRPDDGRLRLRGDLSFSHEETNVQGQASEFQDRLRARASTRYELTDEASIFGEFGLDRRETQGGNQLSTFQTLTGTYTAKPIDWRSFSYAWTAGAGIGNQTHNTEGGSQSQSASASHTLNRVWTPDLSGPVPVVFTAGQEARFVNDSTEGAQTQIVHRATLSATKATDKGTAYGQVSVFDIRTFGRVETELSSLNAAVTLTNSLSRYRSVDAVGSYNYSLSSTSGVDQQRDVLSAELRYRDARLLDVMRLSFESRLRLGATGLLARSEEDTRLEMEWDNRLGYRIGLLEVDARFGVTQTDENRNLLFLLTMTRRF